jgi:hypothetical protein
LSSTVDAKDTRERGVPVTPYGQKIETAQRRQRIFGLGPVLHNKLAVDA